MTEPSTLSRDISPPRPRKHVKFPISKNVSKVTGNDIEETAKDTTRDPAHDIKPTLAAIEAGQAQIHDHLDFFTNHLRSTRRIARNPPLDIEAFEALYRRNQHRHGRHFVVHQHDHPISGVHYDLRLQFSDSSTISFAIPYGLPGNVESVRPNRMGVETRVHTLWNNLIETASHATGSLLIWDTGEYEVLPWKERKISKRSSTDSELSDRDRPDNTDEILSGGTSQSELLFASFQRKRIRLRLHGEKLPRNYTISMWLPSANDRGQQPRKPVRKRRRVDPAKERRRLVAPSDSDEEGDGVEQANEQPVNGHGVEADTRDAGLASDAGEDEDEMIRAKNAYPGAKNTIGSIHQRNWILTLDRRNSGFHRARSVANTNRWIGGWDPFFVRGRDFETSVVTGRNADEVMEDEGVEKFVGRKMWRPILE